jgi:hypothetical protein
MLRVGWRIGKPLQTDRRTDGRRNEYTRFAWAGGTFFLVVLYVVSVFGSGGKRNLFLFLINTLLLYPYLSPYTQTD